jgi:hypothetical protein
MIRENSSTPIGTIFQNVQNQTVQSIVLETNSKYTKTNDPDEPGPNYFLIDKGNKKLAAINAFKQEFPGVTTKG